MNGHGVRARSLAFAIVCALVIPGGGAVGFHSSGGGRFVKHIHAPYDGQHSSTRVNCYLPSSLIVRCRATSSADKSNGNMSVAGSIRPLVPGARAVPDGAVSSTGMIDATDEIPRGARRRGYTVTFHVHRADFTGPNSEAYLGVTAEYANGEGNTAYVPIDSRHESSDVRAYVDLDIVEAGTITIQATLGGRVQQDIIDLPEFQEPSYDVAVTLTRIDVFR